jgi:hypothetical protein
VSVGTTYDLSEAVVANIVTACSLREELPSVHTLTIGGLFAASRRSRSN